jgi:magnesium transporter
MLSVFILKGDGSISIETDEKTLTAAMRDPKAVFWVDMDQPTDDDYSLLDDVFGFHPLAIEDTIQYNQRPKIESYNHVGDAHDTGYFYMVIHGPDLRTFRENVRTKELDIFVSARYLVTIHEEPMASIEHVMKRARGDARRLLQAGIDMLLHSILDQLVDHYAPILDHLQESLEQLEDEALTEPSPALLTKISREKRDLLNLRRIISPQRDVIAQLSRGEVPFIRETCRVYFRDVQDHLNRAVEMIELYRELVASARDLYLSALNNNLNKIMKTLTIVTVVAAVLNVVTGFFGMNFAHIPGLESPAAFWGTALVMGATAVGCVVLFWYKKWL